MRHNLLLNRSRGTASLQPLVLLAIIVVMTGAQAVLVPGSLTVEQMLIISRQASALGIITLGQAAVILVGGIDLSVGATVMMVNIFCISAMQGSDANGPLGLLVCLFIGLAIGTEAGIGILMLTSDMVELIGLSDRTLVFYEGKIVKELSRGEITEERVMKAASGMTEE